MIPLLYQSLWRDEAFSFWLSLKNPLQIIQTTTGDYSPPLYYLVLHYWMAIFGQSEPALRSLSLIFHLGSVALAGYTIYLLTRSRVAAILTSIAVLANPYLLHYAFETRMYAMLSFLFLLALVLLIQKRLFTSSVVLGLAVLTHNFAILYLPSLVVLAWLRKHSLKEMLKLFSIPAAASILWFSVVISQLSRVNQSYWLTTPTLETFYKFFDRYTLGHFEFTYTALLYQTTLVVLIISLVILVTKNITRHLFGIGLVALPFILSLGVSFLVSPIFHDRYHIISVYLLIMAAGYVFASTQNRLSRYISLPVIPLYLLLLCLVGWATLNKPSTAPLKETVVEVLNSQKGNLAVTNDSLHFLETKYYFYQNKASLPLYTYSETGEIPHYIGAVVFEKDDILTQLPKQNYWVISGDGKTEYIP